MAGNAVTSALRARHPSLEVAHWDAVARMNRTYGRIYRWGYVRLVDRHPLLWRALYDATNARVSTLGHFLTIVGGHGFIRACRKFAPDLIVCTHFLAPELLDRAMRKNKIRTRLHAVVTDHDTHRLWAWPRVEHYYVSSEAVEARLALTYGISEDKITITGIPVREQFTREHDARSARANLGLDPDRPTVLFLSGGFAAGPMLRAIQGVWIERRDAQVIAVCGRNARLRRRVARLARPTGATLHALGFTENVAELMSIADFVVSKSGGISTSECMAAGKPMLISGAIAGQEERNALAVVEAGAGVWAPTSEEIRWNAGRLLRDAKRRNAMAKRARAFGRPDAAADVADHVARSLRVEAPMRGPTYHGAPSHTAARA